VVGGIPLHEIADATPPRTPASVQTDDTHPREDAYDLFPLVVAQLAIGTSLAQPVHYFACQRKVEMSYSPQGRNVRFWPG
jgi:hypothetical protein